MTKIDINATQSLSEMKDKYIGQHNTVAREAYEFELLAERIGRMIKAARQKRKLTQSQLGSLVGVQKSHISKLENGANNATLETIRKIFAALDAEITLTVKLN
jgi:HTH-type transcriptional regulator/antitoxin HipB